MDPQRQVVVADAGAPHAWRFDAPAGQQINVYDSAGVALWAFDRSSRQQRQLQDSLSQVAWQLIAQVLADPDHVAMASSPSASTTATAQPAAASHIETRGVDLVTHRPGHALLAHLAVLHAAATTAEQGTLPDEFVHFAVGFVGEEIVGSELARLGSGWHVLHAVPIGSGSSDIDHVVIGPSGVFTINSKHHPGGRLQTKGAETVFLGQAWVPYARNSVAEAKRATERLAASCRFPGQVRAVIAVVGARLNTQLPLDQVVVVAGDRLVAWLQSQPPMLTPTGVEHVFASARWSRTWANTPPVAAAPEWVAETARAVSADHSATQYSRGNAPATTRRRTSSTRRPASTHPARSRGPARAAAASRRIARRGSTHSDLKRMVPGLTILIGLLIFAKPLVHLIESTTKLAVSNVVPAPKPSAGTTCTTLGAKSIDVANTSIACRPFNGDPTHLTWQRP